jgi:uncharacterized protein (TIGR03083 family)
MSTPPIPVAEIPPLTRPESLVNAATEYGRYLELLRSLPADAWARQTECEPWTVRDMASHVLGAAESIASIRETLHQIRAASRRDLNQTDALTAVQVDERVSLSPDQILRRLDAASGASIRARRRLPAPVRRIRFTAELPYGRERWTLAYLMDVIYARDTWMHRVDTARSTGSSLTLTPEHDGRIVANVVADWAGRHRRAFDLALTGPAGGRYRAGDPDGERVELDAVEFCRQLSGRGAPAQGLLRTLTPF